MIVKPIGIVYGNEFFIKVRLYKKTIQDDAVVTSNMLIDDTTKVVLVDPFEESPIELKFNKEAENVMTIRIPADTPIGKYNLEVLWFADDKLVHRSCEKSQIHIVESNQEAWLDYQELVGEQSIFVDSTIQMTTGEFPFELVEDPIVRKLAKRIEDLENKIANMFQVNEDLGDLKINI